MIDYFELPHLSHSRVKAVGSDFDPSKLKQAFARGTFLDAFLTQAGQINASSMTIGEYEYTKDQWDALMETARIAIQNPLIKSIIQHPDTSFQKIVTRTVTFEPYEEWGAITKDCKCLHDYFLTQVSYDIKLLKVSSRDQAEKRVNELYLTQAFWYMEVSQIDEMYFIVVSSINNKVWPFCVKRGDDAFNYGKGIIMRKLWELESEA